MANGNLQFSSSNNGLLADIFKHYGIIGVQFDNGTGEPIAEIDDLTLGNILASAVLMGITDLEVK